MDVREIGSVFVFVVVGLAGCASKAIESSAKDAAPSNPRPSQVSSASPALGAIAVGGGPADVAAQGGLTHLVARSPERAYVRSSTGTAATYAWRIEFTCDQGRGGILRNDLSPRVRFQGDGVFAGWSSAELAKIYQSIVVSFTAEDEEVTAIQLD